MEQYRRNPTACRKITMLSLFQEINSTPCNPKRPTEASFLPFLKNLGESEDISLTGICVQGIKDLYFHGKQEIQDQISDWLKNQETFSVELFIHCLDSLNRRAQEQPVSIYALTQLFRAAEQREWLNDLINETTTIDSICFLLKKAPNDNHVIALIKKIASTKNFSEEMRTRWLNVLNEKEKDHQKNVYYPVRDLLQDA